MNVAEPPHVKEPHAGNVVGLAANPQILPLEMTDVPTKFALAGRHWLMIELCSDWPLAVLSADGIDV